MAVRLSTAIRDRAPLLQQSAEAHAKVFGCEPEASAFAPGRITLLGSHLEYNQGVVLSTGIDRFVAVSGRRDAGPWVRIHSAAFKGILQFNPKSPRPGRDWADPIRGIFAALRQKGYELSGVSIAIVNDLPLGAGVSSSSALEVAIIALLHQLFDLSLSTVDLARIAQLSEHRFLRVRSGLLEPLSLGLSKAGHAIALDLRNLEASYHPIDLSAHRLVLVHSGPREPRAELSYEERRKDCEAAMAALARTHPSLHSLRDVSEDMLLGALVKPRVRQRAVHIVREMRRVSEAQTALDAGDLSTFGALMYASEESARQLYEISTEALDLCAATSRAHGASLGGTVTGPGFGGVSLHLVPTDAVNDFVRAMDAAYNAQFKKHPQMMVCASATGPWAKEDPQPDQP